VAELCNSAGMDSTSEELRAARKFGYESARPDVAAHVPSTATNILELGCSTGALGASIKQRQDVRVVGIEYDAGYAAQAEGRLDRVIVGDAEKVLATEPLPEAPFDCLIAADVLEHLIDPWTVLRRAAGLLSPGATAVVSLPNVLWYEGLWRVVRHRRWPRDPEGVFDQTHLRWFALDDAQDMLRDAGLEPDVVELRHWWQGKALRRRRRLERTRLKPFLAPQYILTAHKPN
jgi:2-polyprenyl-3-methyl-5-hydroxy-6-metoxy-1,4-benzoquinol methylase